MSLRRTITFFTNAEKHSIKVVFILAQVGSYKNSVLVWANIAGGCTNFRQTPHRKRDLGAHSIN